MTDRIEELQRLHEAATKGAAKAVHLDGYHESRVVVGGRVVLRCNTLDEPACQHEAELHAAMRNALPALLRVARAARQMRKAMTTPPKGYGDGHQGYWWTAATEKAAEEVAEAVAELEKP